MVSIYKTLKMFRQKSGFFGGYRFNWALLKLRGNFLQYKNAVKEKDAHMKSESIKDVIILHNDLIRTEFNTVRNNQIDILIGANSLLDKIVYLRQLENQGTSRPKNPKTKRKVRRNLEAEKPNPSGFSDLEDNPEQQGEIN